MDINCNVVRDILPLYVDDVCSSESKEIVDSHVAQCADCAGILAKLKNTECVDALQKETEEVVLKHAKKERRTSFAVGSVFAMILMIPIIVCMIVNLATGHGLSWFFIVLTALMVFASITIVPLMVYRNKLMWTALSFTGSLLIMLATICIYSGGHWFFIAATAVLLGLGFVVVPIVAANLRNCFFARNKGLFVIGVLTLLLLLLLTTIGITVKSPSYWAISMPITTVVLVSVWVMFVIIRYLKHNGLKRAGLAVMWGALVAALAENITFLMMGYAVVFHAFHPFTWTAATIGSNCRWLEFIGLMIVGISLFVGGIKKDKKN